MIVLAWLALALPGFVFVLTRLRSSLEAGILPTLGLSWMCSFAAYFVLAVPCFLLNASLDVYVSLIALLFVWAAVELWRRKPWKGAGKAGLEFLGVETIVVGALGWGFSRIGANPGGDAVVHSTRIRQLLDHGLTNVDPWVGDGHFFSLYHTNLIHTLHALVARATGTHFFEEWHASLGASAIMVLCGGAQLAWQIHRSRWAAWAGGLGAFVAVATTSATLLSLPNKLAPFYFMPTALACALAVVRKCDRASIGLFAAAVLTTSAAHSLYGVFLVVLLGPLLALNWLWIRRKGEGSLRNATLALFALIVMAAPMPLVTQITKNRAKAQNVVAKRNENISDAERIRRRRLLTLKMPKATRDNPTRYVQVGERYLVDPLRGFGGKGGIKIRFVGIRYVLLATCIALAFLASRSRRTATALLIILLTGSGVLFIPFLATALADLIGSRWILLRLFTATFPVPFTACAAGLAAVVEARLEKPWFRIVGTALVIAVIIFAWGKSHLNKWDGLIERARSGASAPSDEEMRKLRNLRAVMDENVPSQARILIDMNAGMQLVRIADVHILAPTRAALGVPGLHRLRVANRNLIAADMPWEKRRAKLLKHDIRFFLPLEFPEWAVGHVKRDIRDPRLDKVVLLELDLEE